MPDTTELDPILEERLEALIRGATLEDALDAIPEEAWELSGLIEVAAAIRDLPQPQLAPAVMKAQHAQVMKAAAARRSFVPKWLTPKSSVFKTFAVMTGVLLLVIASGLYFINGPAQARAATLTNVRGLVEVVAADEGDTWHVVMENEPIHQGARIRTYPGASAALTFYDGSMTTMGASSDLVVTHLNGWWGKSVQVQLAQPKGSNTYEVVPLRGSNSFFRVDTPSGRVEVWGTKFGVSVAEDGRAIFSVTRGKVSVENAGAEVQLNAGQITQAFPGQNPKTPAYQFTQSGRIDALEADQWRVNGISFVISPETHIQGTYQTGATVFIQGHILNGARVADWIQPADEAEQSTWLAGVLENPPEVPGDWRISGQMLHVNEDTRLSDGIKPGSVVGVFLNAVPLSGEWVASAVEVLDGTGWENEVTPSTVAASPEGTEASATAGVGGEATWFATPSFEGSGRCGSASLGTEAVTLAERYSVSPETIFEWFCKGYGYGEIDMAYQLSLELGVPVEEIFALRESGLSWGQIKQQLAEKATPQPKPTKTLKPTHTPKPTKDIKPTPTPKPTKVPEPTHTPRVEKTKKNTSLGTIADAAVFFIQPWTDLRLFRP